MKIKIIHVITGLDTGGAEMMLYKLLSKMNQDEFDAQVVSLTDIGPVGKKIQGLGLPVRALGMNRLILRFLALFRLLFWVKKSSPCLIQSWMYHADFMAGIVAKLTNTPVIWGIHHTNLDPALNKQTTIRIAKLCSHLSGFMPEKIVCCSEASKRVHQQLGYNVSKMQVIPNGFDLEQYKPNRQAYSDVRKMLNLDGSCFLIGLVARFDPQKDHHNFIKAAAILNKRHPQVHFLLCGDGVDATNKELMEWIKAAKIETNVHLLGRRDDVAVLNSALDIASTSSRGEGFPNVIGEAMACGVPCVVTDVGDSALLVGETGLVVPPKDEIALASAWQNILTMPVSMRNSLGVKARERVLIKFSLSSIVDQYQSLYRSVATSAQ
ncbi:glycosyltransferase family 4 protein [Methylotuvimicrobium sp.]|uniref:glycosyltransferase family 4 protein n=1 Tax=Methylotuvimicrobium sp. TaxID=2822413 RepID=UPI003D64B5AE